MCLAVPGLVLSVSQDDALLRTARVSFAGAIRQVSLACVPEAAPGNYVVVHAGIAISLLDEAEATRVLTYLHQLEEQDREVR